jgi:hypothetical protein
MEPVREILHMLAVRLRVAQRRVRNASPTNMAYVQGQRDEALYAFEQARIIYRLGTGGSPQAQEERRRVIRISSQREEFVTLADGYVHFWPDGSPHGALTAWHLRTLADELDHRNRRWDAHVRKSLPGPVDDS